MSWTQSDTSFKKLNNKRVTTSTGKGLAEEKGASTLELYLPDIKTELIPGTPPGASTSVLAYTGSIGQTLAVDTSVPGNLTWFATTGYGNTTTANDGSAGSEANRLMGWISDKYDAFGTVSGNGYEIKVYDKDSNLITKADPSDWLFDYQTGILVFNNASTAYGAVTSSGPFRIVGYRYIGQKGTIPASFGGLGYTTYTKGDLLVGAGGTFIKFGAGTDNYVLTASSSSAIGLTWLPTAATGLTTLNGLNSGIQYLEFGYSGTVPAFSSSGSTHTLNIPLAGSGSTGLISTQAQTIAGQKTFTSAILGDLTGTATTAGFATTASYSYQSGYGITAGFATTASYSYQSGYGITAGFATTSSYAYQSGYGITAGFANTASYSYQSGYGITSGFATTASYAYQSGYGITSGFATTASYSYQSGYGITSGFATTANYAYQSGYGITSGFATTAANINVVNAISNLAHPLIFGSTASGSGIAASSNTTISYNPSTFILSTPGLAVTSSTASTSYNTGALIVTGGVGIGGSLYVNGDLTINGTTTTINSVTLTVDDKNIELGSVNSPTDVTAEAGGITLKGTTDKFINWYTGTGWSSNQDWNLASGLAYKINNTSVLSASSLGTGVTNSSLTAVGTITTGIWAGTLITALYGGTGYSSYTKGDLLVGSGNTFVKLGVGTDNFVLTADTASPGGVKWTSVAGLSITSINGLTASAQYFSTGVTGTGFNISSSGSTHTFNIPIAGTGATGLVSTLAQSFAGTKTFTGDVIVSSTTGSTAYNTGALTVYGGLGVSGQLSFNQAALGYTGAINPSIAFIGSTTAAPITLTVLSDNSLLWEGTSGKLFGINNNLSSGWIFNVGDISGLPIIRANADGTIAMAEFAANVGIGLSNPSYKLHVAGDTNLSSGYVYRINGTSVLSSSSLGTGVTNSSLTALGTITTGVWAATAITALYGGTGLTPTFTVGDILYANTTSTWGRLAANSNSGYVLASAGSGATPTYIAPSTLSVGYATTSGLATTASYSYQSGYGITSGFATTSANINIANASTGTFYPLLSNTFSAVSGLGVSVNGLISVNAATGAFGATSVNIFGGQSYSIGGTSVLSYTQVLGLTVTSGNITSGTWSGTAISVPYGGTGLTTYTIGDILYASGSATIGKLTAGTAGSVLISAGTGATPYYTNPLNITSGLAITATNLNVVNATSNSAHPLHFSPVATGSGVAVSSNTTLSYNPSSLILSVSGLAVTAGTASTSSSTGALVVTGGVGIGGSLFVNGDLTINGTTTTINSVTLTVDDKNIELGSVNSPTDVTAEAGGITLKGTTDKYINWYSGTGWSSSESWNLASGNTYKINNTSVLSASSLGTGVTNSSLTALGIVTTGTWSATAITALYGGTGLAPSFTVGDILYANTSSTWGRLPASSNTGYVLTSAGSGATPTYVAQSSLSVGSATTATYAHQSGYAITSGTASTASNLNTVAASTNATHYILFSPVNGGSGVAVSSGTGLTFNPASNTISLSILSATTVNTSTASVTGSTASTSTSSGALIVTGGVGIGGSLNVASATAISGVTINNGIITGNLTGTATTASNLNVVNASTGTFYPLLSNTASSISGVGASVNSLFSYNTATGAFGATSVNIFSGQSYSIGGTSVLSATSLGVGVTNSSLTAVGTITTGTWAGSTITGLYGGTGYTTYTKGDLLVGAGGTFIKLNVGSNNYVLTASSSSGSGLTWKTASAATATTSIAPSSPSSGDFWYDSSDGTLSIYYNDGDTSQWVEIAGAFTGTVGSGNTYNIPYYNATGIAITGSTNFTNVGTGISILYTAGSISTTTGALVVSGGVGIGGSVYTSSSYASSISGVVLSNGSVTVGTWAGSAITSRYGGTGYTTYSNGDILVGSGGTLVKVGSGSTNYILSSSSIYPAGVGWTWVSAVGVGTNPPSTTHDSDLWWNANDGSLNFYYNDGDTSQWVEIAGGSGIDLSQPVHITSTVGSTSVSTGALIVDGGVGIQGELHAASLVINGTYDVVGTSVTLATTAANQVIFTLDSAVYRSVKFMVQISHGSDFQVQEILLLHDAIDTYLTQYAQLLSGNNLILATYDADLNSGDIRLLVTPTYTNTTFKIYGTAVRL
jgi:hypothetical protein